MHDLCVHQLLLRGAILIYSVIQSIPGTTL